MSRWKRFALAATVAAAAVSAGAPAPVRALDTAPPVQTEARGAAGAAGAAAEDGTRTGPRVNTFYGYLRVEAVISGGALTEVRVPEYPAHDGTSRRINKVAIPYLVKSAVSTGGAEVDAISGATITSKAFARSLEAAMAGAGR